MKNKKFKYQIPILHSKSLKKATLGYCYNTGSAATNRVAPGYVCYNGNSADHACDPNGNSQVATGDCVCYAGSMNTHPRCAVGFNTGGYTVCNAGNNAEGVNCAGGNIVES